METLIHWRQRSPYAWMIQTALAAGFILVVAAAASAVGGFNWLPLFPLAIFPLWLRWLLQADVWVLSHGVLAVQSYGGSPRFIPLAAVELKRERGFWRLTWHEGMRRYLVRLPHDERFAPALEEAVRRAHAEAGDEDGPGGLPRTAREAARAIAISIPQPVARARHAITVTLVLSLVVIAIYMAAFWLDSPLALLPIAALPYLVHRFQERHRLVLTPDGLWFALPGEAPVLAPLETVSLTPGMGYVTVRADRPGFPAVAMREELSSDLFRRLRTALREREARALAQEAGLPEQAEPLRCTLCGRPIAGMAAGTTPAVGSRSARGGKGTVLICDRCGGRTRYEAQETGHGLAGKEPKPMG